MAKKSSDLIYNPWSLFALAAVLLSAGWLMKPFPVLIFAGFAPLFAITDQAKNHSSPWNRFELILLALALAFFAAQLFETTLLVFVLAQAIVFTLTFVGYSFAYQSLGSRLGKFTVIFFWLALEYMFLKLPWIDKTIFLADALLLQPKWLNWTFQSGYLGASLWILCVNLVFYLSFFYKKVFNAYLFILAILMIAAPILISYQVEHEGISRAQMILSYSQGTLSSTSYDKQGELIARSAVWISVLILLLSFVKNKTSKK